MAELFGVEAGVRVGCTKAIRVRAREPPYRRVAIDPNADFGRQTLHKTQTDVPIAFIAREPRNRRDGDAGARRGETPIFRARGKTLSKRRLEIPDTHGPWGLRRGGLDLSPVLVDVVVVLLGVLNLRHVLLSSRCRVGRAERSGREPGDATLSLKRSFRARASKFRPTTSNVL